MKIHSKAGRIEIKKSFGNKTALLKSELEIIAKYYFQFLS